MVDPIIHHNPFIPRGARAEARPSDGRIAPTLIPCQVCKLNGVPYVCAPRNNAYVSRCVKCGAPHVFKAGDKSFKDVAREGSIQRVGPERTYKGSKYVDATKTFEELRRKRELGHHYWRNPK